MIRITGLVAGEGYLCHDANKKFGVAKRDSSYFARIVTTALGLIKR